MDMGTISAALTSLGLAAKFLKDSIEKIKDEAVREKVKELLDTIIPLQTYIISLNETISSLRKEKEAIEQKLREIEDWRQEAASYELVELASGVYAYMKKKTIPLSEPPHYLCAKCYNDRKKSILQRVRQSHAGMHYVCHSCSSEIIDHSNAKPFPTAEQAEGWDPFV